MILKIRTESDASLPHIAILQDYKGSALVNLAKSLRKSEMMSASYLSILQGSEMGEENSVLQKAKWLWKQRLNHEAINTLAREISCGTSKTGSLLHGKVRLK